jgi:hypothetical protein
MRPAIRTTEVAVRGIMALALAGAMAGNGRASAADRAAPAPLASLAASFRLDPLLTRSLYMGERWVTPASFNSVSSPIGTAISVEARARAFDARGRTMRVSPAWTPSDPQMVTVSPARGETVTLMVRRPGTSTVTLSAGGLTRTLTLHAVPLAGAWRVDITQALRQAPGPAPVRASR